MPDPRVNTEVPHSARLWNYWLGGKDNFASDRAAGDEIARRLPSIIDMAVADRAFLGRMVRHLVAERGIRQILDIGTGLPTADNTHQVAQSIAPDTRVVYVDNDPLVLVHARALLTSTPEGATEYIEADLNDPDTIIAAARRTLDFSRPVAVTLLGILHFILDDDAARAVVARLVDALPSGSYLVQCDGTDSSPAYIAAIERYRDSGGVPYNVRTHEQIAGFYEGLELVEPGVVNIPEWRPEETVFGGSQVDIAEVGGVGRKR